MRTNIKIEICVDSVASAEAAQRGGADRIELCSDLLEGGITPSAGLIEAVRQKISIPLHVMIRPRGGDFLYDENELDVMRRDIAVAKRLGAEGVVFGLLDRNGNIDTAQASQMIELARPLAVTFHRAFDMSPNPLRALEDVCAAGADHLLTSGGEQTSIDGANNIAALVRAAQDRIVIMAGSGIRPENAATLIQRTGVREIHVGMATKFESPMLFRKEHISMGKIAGREYLRSQLSEETVRALCQVVECTPTVHHEAV